jgi:hypothetical protein
MFTWAQTEITEWTSLIPLAILLVGGWAIVHTFHKTRAFIPVLAVALTTGVAAWAASSGGIGWIEGKVKADTGAPAPGAPAHLAHLALAGLPAGSVVTLAPGPDGVYRFSYAGLEHTALAA